MDIEILELLGPTNHKYPIQEEGETVSTIEERLAGGGSSLPWIPDPEKAAKYDRDCCTLNPLIGTAVDHFRRLNFRGDGEYDCVVLNVEGVGDVAVHCQATVLASQMHAARPKPGEKVGIVWNGEKTGSSGTAYTDYRVVVERERGGEFSWSDGPAPEEEFQTQAPPPEVPAPAPVPTPAPTSTPVVTGSPVQPDDDIPFEMSIF